MNPILITKLLYYLIELFKKLTLMKFYQKQKKKKNFINMQRIENILDLNLEFLFLKVVIHLKERIIKKKNQNHVVQVYQIIKVVYQDSNQTKEF